MAIHSELVESDGGPVIVHRAEGADAGRLRRMAGRLERAAHPGVVQVVGSSGTDDRWELRMAYGGRPLDLAGRLTPGQVASAAASVSATLADLHAAGIVHGRLDASRVLVGPHGRPVLCGFGDDDHCSPEDDVAAVGRLVVELLGRHADTEPGSERPWRGRRPDQLRRSLLLIADHACAEPPSRRPSARSLAASIAAASPGTSPTVKAPRPPRHARSGGAGAAGRRRAARWLAGTLCVVAVTAASSSLRTAFQDGPLPPRTGTAGPSAVSTRGSTGTSARVQGDVGGSPGPCPRPCDPIVIMGTTVRVGTARFEIGRPGDRVVVGDWACSDAPTPAVLRPSTGEVFVFPGWAEDGEVTITPTTTVAGGHDLVVEHDELGCSVLTVVREDGARTPVRTEGRT